MRCTHCDVVPGPAGPAVAGKPAGNSFQAQDTGARRDTSAAGARSADAHSCAACLRMVNAAGPDPPRRQRSAPRVTATCTHRLTLVPRPDLQISIIINTWYKHTVGVGAAGGEGRRRGDEP